MKVKIYIDNAATQGLLNTFFETLQSCTKVIGMRASVNIVGLELETLILLDYHQRNYLKLKFTPLPYKLGMKPHEALSLCRVLFDIDLDDPLLDILRNEFCGEIHKQVGHLN
jgi:hypothetical protein